MTCSRVVLIMGCAAGAGFGSACQDTQSAAPGELSAGQVLPMISSRLPHE